MVTRTGYILLLTLLVAILLGVFFTFKRWRGHCVKMEDDRADFFDLNRTREFELAACQPRLYRIFDEMYYLSETAC